MQIQTQKIQDLDYYLKTDLLTKKIHGRYFDPKKYPERKCYTPNTLPGFKGSTWKDWNIYDIKNAYFILKIMKLGLKSEMGNITPEL